MARYEVIISGDGDVTLADITATLKALVAELEDRTPTDGGTLPIVRVTVDGETHDVPSDPGAPVEDGPEDAPPDDEPVPSDEAPAAQ